MSLLPGGRARRARLAPGALLLAASVLLAVSVPRARATLAVLMPDGRDGAPGHGLDPRRVAAFLDAVRGAGATHRPAPTPRSRRSSTTWSRPTSTRRRCRRSVRR